MAEHTVGERIRSRRESSGTSLRGFAARLGVSPATLSAIERDLTPITVDRLEKVASLLGVTTDRLLSDAPVTEEAEVGAGAGDPDWRRFHALELSPVLVAAIDLFVTRGYHATSMREIASAAGVSVAGIYHHYPSKQRILSHVLDLTMAEIDWRLSAARREGAGPVDSFALMVESLALFHAVQRDLAFIGASEMRAFEPAERARVTRLRDRVQHALDQQAEACCAAGCSTVADVRVATRAIATMCTSLPSWFSEGGPMRPEEVARLYARYALRMLGLPEGDQGE